MTLNLSCCQNVKFDKLFCCREKTETPPSTPEPVVNENTIGISLVESKHIKFEHLIPDHKDFIYLKILRDGVIISAEGDFITGMGMSREDLIGKKIKNIEKNRELFGDFIYPLFKKSIETRAMYQFCFKITRVICCSIYPCVIPGLVSSVDCVIRPARVELDIDKFVVELSPK